MNRNKDGCLPTSKSLLVIVKLFLLCGSVLRIIAFCIDLYAHRSTMNLDVPVHVCLCFSVFVCMCPCVCVYTCVPVCVCVCVIWAGQENL